MRTRFLARLFTAALALAIAGPAAAQNAQKKGEWVEPPQKLPHAQRGDPARNLEFLFGALKAAPDDETAKAVEQRI